MVLAKVCILLIFLLLFSLNNCFIIASDNISETKNREDADENNNKKSKKIIRFIDNKNGIFSCLKGVKAFNFACYIGFSMLSFSKDMRVFIFRLLSVDMQNHNLLRLLNFIGGLIIIIIAGLVLFIFGEALSKRVAIAQPQSCANKTVNINLFLCTLCKPVFYILDLISIMLSHIFGMDPSKDEDVTEEEIRLLVEDAEESGAILESQREIINNIFEFDDIDVGDVMNHRTEIVAVEVTQKLDEALKLAIDEGFSRIPVFEDDLDNIIGIIYVKDLLKYVGKKLPEKSSIRSVMREAYHVPQTKLCAQLFKEMTENRIQMAIVVDEYGGTAGIVTLEDLIESVLGNIQDEYDDEEEDIKKVDEKTFTIDGICDIEEVEEMLGVDLPQGDYDTLGGLILSILGRIPKEDEHPFIELEGYKFTVASVDERRIETVKAEKLPEEAPIEQ